MARSAYVHNTEAIEAVREVLAYFAQQVDQGLTEIEAESRRMLDWLEHDRPRYWKNQIRLAWDGVQQAKQELQRCRMYPIADERPSCTEQRAALKKAEQRLAYCQQKEERLRHWCRELRHEWHDYQGRIAQLKDGGQLHVPQAIATLNKILRSIEAYQQLSAPTPKTDTPKPPLPKTPLPKPPVDDATSTRTPEPPS